MSENMEQTVDKMAIFVYIYQSQDSYCRDNRFSVEEAMKLATVIARFCAFIAVAGMIVAADVQRACQNVPAREVDVHQVT